MWSLGSCIIVGDINQARLALVKKAGYDVAGLTRDMPLDALEPVASYVQARLERR
jgi:hypothetical protein